MRHLAVFFTGLLCFVPAQGSEKSDRVRLAAEKGLRRLEVGAESYTKNRTCFSCHHQAMAVFVMAAAQEHGFTVERAGVQRQLEFTLATFRSKHEALRKGQGVPGGNTMAAYALVALQAGGEPANETTAALVDYLLGRQREDGAWPGVTDRPPSEGSAFTSTALTMESLAAFGRTSETEIARANAAIAKGKKWLTDTHAKTTEDRVFRLRGLVAGSADRNVIDAERDELLRGQKEGGAWSQLPELAGDAYATGSALVALRRAGLPLDHPAVRKGVAFLLSTQREDGAWLVETRSRPVQVFFDNGDPGGKSQFISFAATGWATLALLECLSK